MSLEDKFGEPGFWISRGHCDHNLEIMGADMLVTGDRDLLQIAGAVPLPSLTPRLAWEQLRGGRDL